MNKKQLAIQRNNTARGYHTPAAPSKPRPRNAIFTNPTNSLVHETTKFILCYTLQECGKSYVTEAVDKNTSKRRDVVCLDDHTIYEIETSKTRGSRHTSKNVVVILTDRNVFSGSVSHQNISMVFKDLVEDGDKSFNVPVVFDLKAELALL